MRLAVNSNERNLNHLPLQQNVLIVYAPLVNVPTMQRREEYVADMEESIFVMKRDVPTLLSMEEFVLDMVPGLRKEFADMKDVQIKLSMEEYASSMELRERVAHMKDVPIEYRREECVSDIVPRSLRLAAMRVVPSSSL